MSGALERANSIAFGCGPKGSGKTYFLWHRFTKHHRRVLTLDVVGEVREKYNPQVVEAYGLADVKRALGWCAQRSDRWHVAAFLDEPDYADLFELLAPPFRPGTVSFPQAVGGMALECSEIDEVLPNTGGNVRSKAAIKRGRHHRLSFYLATQRPSETARVVTSQADVIYSLRHDEPLELAWLAKKVSPLAAEIVAELPERHVLYYLKSQRRVYLCDHKQRAYRVLSLAGTAQQHDVARS